MVLPWTNLTRQEKIFMNDVFLAWHHLFKTTQIKKFFTNVLKIDFFVHNSTYFNTALPAKIWKTRKLRKSPCLFCAGLQLYLEFDNLGKKKPGTWEIKKKTGIFKKSLYKTWNFYMFRSNISILHKKFIWFLKLFCHHQKKIY